MVFVKVRETYDLHTVKNKMTVIGIHTPRPGILKRNFPGLLMQCRAYRPVSADVRVACASVLPLDPRGVGTTTDDVAPEDVFNPILYKAMSNLGMSQLEARINAMAGTTSPTVGPDVYGDTALADVDSLTDLSDEFPVYYGLLSQSGVWRHANPQAGLEMKGLKPLVYELVFNMNDQIAPGNPSPSGASFPGADGDAQLSGIGLQSIRGKAKPMPFINTTAYSKTTQGGQVVGSTLPGFSENGVPNNAEENVPYLTVMCGCIIIPPSRLHELYYRMVVEWTIEFSSIRPISEIVTWGGLGAVGATSHFQNYNYAATRKAVTGADETILDSDQTMVSANVEVTKVM